jgi:hypothetical protein
MKVMGFLAFFCKPVPTHQASRRNLMTSEKRSLQCLLD